jgi:probable rRNA maturation factor
MAMEIDVSSSVSGAPTARQTRAFLRRLERLHPPAAPNRGRPEPELSIFFCGDSRMRALNRRYRRRDRSTDVLAFPGEGAALGDIVISLPYAAREARRRGDSRGRELDRLLLHGYLHLNGYDHEVDSGQMDRLEGSLRSRLGLSREQRPAAIRRARAKKP